jgi:hypothetical protein
VTRVLRRRINESIPVPHRSRVTVTLNDGRVRVGVAGGDENDLSAPRADTPIDEKFRKFAGAALGEARANTTRCRLWPLQDLTDAGAFGAARVIAEQASSKKRNYLIYLRIIPG